MKAKLILMGPLAEIVLDNAENKTYKVEFEKNGEYDVEDFKADVAAKVQDEFMEELEFEQIDEAGLKKLSPAALKKQAADAKGLEADLIKKVLKAGPKGKGPSKAAVKPEPKKAAAKKEAKPKKEAAPKVPKTLTKEQQERADALEAAKSTKEYKDAKRNLGKKISYTAKRGDVTIEGEIKGLSFSKDLKRIYYTVNAGDKTTCCAVTNETLELE